MIDKCPNPQGGCPYRYRRGCYSDAHHTYYPESSYKTPMERQFRSLPENIVQTCRWVHDDIHEFDTPPIKPSVQQMIARLAAGGLIDGTRPL